MNRKKFSHTNQKSTTQFKIGNTMEAKPVSAAFASGGGIAMGSGFGFESEGGMSGFQPATAQQFATANPVSWGFSGGLNAGSSGEDGLGGGFGG